MTSESWQLFNRFDGLEYPFSATPSARPAAAFAGGSVTQGANSTSRDTLSYRPLTFAWLQTNYPALSLYQANSGFGSNASWADLFRLQAEVLDRNPALIVLEAAVNDQNALLDRQAAEALIRRCLGVTPRPKVVPILFLRVNDPAVNNTTNTYQYAWNAWSALATHYNLPVADFASWVQSVVPGTYNLNQLLADTVHPLDLGHSHAATLLEAQLADLNPVVGALPAPLYDTNGDFSRAPQKIYGDQYSAISGTWSQVAHTMTTTDIATPATISYALTCRSFSFIGSTATYYFKVDNGSYTLASATTVDGNDCGSYGAHTVTIKPYSVGSPVSIFQIWAI